jgi:hypothetical protein
MLKAICNVMRLHVMKDYGMAIYEKVLITLLKIWICGD